MKRDFENALLSGKHLPAAGESPLLWPVKYMSGEVGMYMSYWYGGLFVVCEGWQELGLSDAKVDPLLDIQTWIFSSDTDTEHFIFKRIISMAASCSSKPSRTLPNGYTT